MVCTAFAPFSARGEHGTPQYVYCLKVIFVTTPQSLKLAESYCLNLGGDCVEITTFKKDYLPDMAGIFIRNFKQLRSSIPALPNLMEEPDRVIDGLSRLFDRGPGRVARAGIHGLAYRPSFCGTGAGKAHSAGMQMARFRKPDLRFIGRCIARHQVWAESGCQVQLLTLLAHDRPAEKVWFLGT